VDKRETERIREKQSGERERRKGEASARLKPGRWEGKKGSKQGRNKKNRAFSLCFLFLPLSALFLRSVSL
jgi:hypothetical protein